MEREEEYRLSLYQDLGLLDGRENIRLKRHKTSGRICVEKNVHKRLEPIYRFVQRNPSPYFPFLYECIIDGESLILIEEYIQGKTLEDMIHERKIDEWEGIEILLELCSALKVLHHGPPMIVCRDLKAENVMIDQHGKVKLIDFNIARIHQSGKTRDTSLLGTAEYAAPEQYGFFQTDGRTDIYALGVLLNYMLIKKFPVEQMIGGRGAWIVRKCTYLDPKERYQCIEELEKDIKEFYPKIYHHSYIQKGESKNRSFIPPGFRSKTPWKMFIAVLGYLLLTGTFFSLELTDKSGPLSGWRLFFEQLIFWISQLVWIALIWNYRGWRDEFKIFNNKSWIVKIGLYLLAELILLLIAAFIVVIGETIFL
ncbi:serine/threonine protein kinase [bacterium 1XD42-8]|nr:protein kinase [Lachnospiraceae bacterium]RKJ38127.1 serine/threonine protein kinase [bacterium 1XD42-8]